MKKLPVSGKQTCYWSMGTSKNVKLCVMRPRQNAHLLCVNDLFVTVASLDFAVFRGSPILIEEDL
jgi:hypothetical protein